MTLFSGHKVPYIEVTKDGTTYRLPVQQQGSDKTGYRPVPVPRSPKLSLPPPIAIAGPEGGQFRRNYDIDEIILIDWSYGMSVDVYPPNTPPSGVQYGELDTRTDGYLTPPPQVTPVGGAVPWTSGAKRIMHPGFTDAWLLEWTAGANAYRYTTSIGDWTTAQSGGANMRWYDATEGLGQLWAVGLTAGFAPAVWRSTDGVTWTAMAVGAIASPWLVAVFDERLCVLNYASGVATLYTSADVASAGGGGGTWVAGNTFRTTGVEQPQRLFVWQYPLDRGKPTLWCLTGSRLLYYDYYAATPNWKEWFQFRSPHLSLSIGNIADAYVWPKNGNLYTCSSYDEFVMEFTGNTIAKYRPNRGRGLPSAWRLAPNLLAGDDDFLYAFCGVSGTDGDAQGAVVAMAEGGAFHHIYRPTTAGYQVTGGGVSSGVLWVAEHESPAADVSVLHIPTIDALIAPHLTTERTYDSAARQATTGWLHCNLLNVNKRLLQFEVDAIKANGAPGLDTECAIQIEYRRRGGSFVSAGTLTDASTFPAVLAISGGYSFKELQLRITLDRGGGGASEQAAFVKAIKVGYRPRPKQRYTYTARVDLRDGSPAFMTDDEKFHGYSASKLREILDELADNDDSGADDTLVGLAYGGYGNLLHPRRRSASQCEVSIQAQESPEGGDGLYLMIFNDVSAGTSG